MLEYLFDATTPPLSSTALMVTYAVIGVCVAAAGAAGGIRAKRKRGPFGAFLKRVMRAGIVLAGIGILVVGFRQQGVYVLSARIVYFSWLAGIAAWAYALVRYAQKRLPRQLERARQEEERRRYLPGRASRA